jgi:hypothetical protein
MNHLKRYFRARTSSNTVHAHIKIKKTTLCQGKHERERGRRKKRNDSRSIIV